MKNLWYIFNQQTNETKESIAETEALQILSNLKKEEIDSIFIWKESYSDWLPFKDSPEWKSIYLNYFKAKAPPPPPSVTKTNMNPNYAPDLGTDEKTEQIKLKKIDDDDVDFSKLSNLGGNTTTVLKSSLQIPPPIEDEVDQDFDFSHTPQMNDEPKIQLESLNESTTLESTTIESTSLESSDVQEITNNEKTSIEPSTEDEQYPRIPSILDLSPDEVAQVQSSIQFQMPPPLENTKSDILQLEQKMPVATEDLKERRQHERHEVKFRVIITNGTNTFLTYSKNIGLGGMLTEHEIPDYVFKSESIIVLQHPRSKEPLTFKCSPVGDRQNANRLKFHEIGPKNVSILSKWLNEIASAKAA